MKKLRELLAKAVPGEWHYDGMHDEITSNQAKNYWVANDICIDEVCEREYDQFGHSYSPTLDLICAMHNALPELLDAWEMVQKIDEWAKTPSGIQSAVTLGGYQYAQFDVEKMIRQWRDAHADTKTD